MSSAILLSELPATPLNLQDLGPDLLETILIHVPPRDAFESRATCTAIYPAATSEALWSVMLEKLLESTSSSFYAPDTSKHTLCSQLPPSVTKRFSRFSAR